MLDFFTCKLQLPQKGRTSYAYSMQVKPDPAKEEHFVARFSLWVQDIRVGNSRIESHRKSEPRIDER